MKNKILVVMGLGYVGLPVALKFSKKIKTIGFDISSKRVNELKSFRDINNDYSDNFLKKHKKINYSNSSKVISDADYILVTVPTPINKKKGPDFSPLNLACKEIGKNIKKKP